MKVDLDDLSSDDELSFHTGLGFKKPKVNHEEEYEMEIEIPKFKIPQSQPQRARLNLFQEDFEQTPKPQVQDTPNNQHHRIYKEYQRNQAFANFQKSNASLLSNVEKGVTVKIFDKNMPKNEKLNETEYKIKQKRSVQFNLENNVVHPIVKHEEEYLTLAEKLHLSSNIRRAWQLYRIDSDSEVEAQDDQSDDSIVQVVSSTPSHKPKGILKKKLQVFKEEEGKKTITVEQVAFKDSRNKKNLSQREKKTLEKRVEEHDYGVGLKFLQKLGYKYGEGLGANKQGILEPVIAVKKQSFTGEGVQEYQQQDEEEEQENNQTQENKQKPFFQSKKLNKYEKQWRKKQNKEDGQVTVNIRKEEVMNLDRNHIMGNLIKENQNSNKYKIIDMTGSDINDYLNQTQDAQVYSNKAVREYLKEVQELTWSVKTILEKRLGKWENNEQSIKKEKDKMIILEHEKQEELMQFTQWNDSVKRKEDFLNYLKFFKDDDILISNDKFHIFTKFEECFRKFSDQFIQFNLIGLLVKNAEQEIKVLTSKWKGPITNLDILEYEFQLISDVITLAKDVYIKKKSQNLSKYAEQLDVFIINNSISTSDLNTLKRFIGLLIAPILIRLRNYLSVAFDPTQENYLIDFLGLWMKDLALVETDETGVNQFQSIRLLDQQVQKDIMCIVMSKLKLKIQEWNLNSKISLHQWLQPWITSKLNSKELLEEVEKKLKQLKFTDKDDFGFSVLQPWAIHLGENWKNLLYMSVLPKMLFCIHNLEINPQNQNVQPIKEIFKWMDEIEPFIEMIFQPLIEKLSRTLENWILQLGSKEEMNKQADYSQLSRWLDGWERFLMKRVIQKVYKFETQFNSMKQKII
ncbi:unnamed protein product (macronuclear) [Paramecium tetraurelia]|uniref:G-patch domain-containing protein n=1 Tax=Paramecium tetraurelia TaxID=5888 RepID=A0EH57_PARTE|nr:uncharacterized protein GSPATT00026972001 [Paramecium tetraurelia]CAK94648.1 unnamed protein product [Paramecium tetraurelia]|eukprot:XP_001462021.1 hypothetical protein (macronuclear) [Paramecium tetraurelia strain d4-2]